MNVLKRSFLALSLFFSASSLFAVSVDTNVTGGTSPSDTVTANSVICTDCVDGTDLADTITLDAALTVAGSSVTVSSHVLVTGTLTAGASSGSNELRIDGGAASNVSIGFYDAGTARNQIIQNNGSEELLFTGGAGWIFNNSNLSIDWSVDTMNYEKLLHVDGSADAVCVGGDTTCDGELEIQSNVSASGFALLVSSQDATAMMGVNGSGQMLIGDGANISTFSATALSLDNGVAFTVTTATIAGLLFIPADAAPRTNITPGAAGALIRNTGLSPNGELCFSTGTTATTWVKVSTPTAACSN